MLISLALFILFGFLVGVVAKMLVGSPGTFWSTTGVGIAGALVGGLVAYGSSYVANPWTLPGFFLALLGATVLILGGRLLRGLA